MLSEPAHALFLFLSLALPTVALSSGSLNSSCAPGGNFVLSPWSLQLPTSSIEPITPITIPASELEGCSGYSRYPYFYTEDGDGALAMDLHESLALSDGSIVNNGCSILSTTDVCTIWLEEATKWDPNSSPNELNVTLSIQTTDTSKYGIVFAQINVDNTISTQPIVELYYSSNGTITAGVGASWLASTTFIPLGSATAIFSFQLTYENNYVGVGINGERPSTVGSFDADAPLSYFRVGNYMQTQEASSVHFFSISISH